MTRLSRLLVTGSILSGCVSAVLLKSAHVAFTMPGSPTFSTEVAQLNFSQGIDFEQHFQDLNVEGSILIYDLNSAQIYQHNPERSAAAFLPASTFKILNSLIALEIGVIPNELSLLTWDGVQRTVLSWNRDLNMQEAFKLSAIWFYQALARRTGHERMQQWVTQAGYGNQNIGNKEDIDKFWLEGELRITSQQQIQFLRRLYQNDLPFSEKTLSTVKEIMIVEKAPEYVIRAKSGWVGFEQPELPQIGWYVGYLERDENVYFFATNIDLRNENDPRNRAEITRKCFEELGLL